MTKTQWQKVLEPFANEVARLDERLGKRLEHMTDSGLEKLAEAVKLPTTGNCWWATWDAAQKLQSLVHIEQCSRRARFKKLLRKSVEKSEIKRGGRDGTRDSGRAATSSSDPATPAPRESQEKRAAE